MAAIIRVCAGLLVFFHFICIQHKLHPIQYIIKAESTGNGVFSEHYIFCSQFNSASCNMYPLSCRI